MSKSFSYLYILILWMGVGLIGILPCEAIQMAGEGRKISEEELNSMKIVREGQALKVMEKKDVDPPFIIHDPIREMERGKALTIDASISDESGIRSATLGYRTIGQRLFEYLDMEPGQENLYRAIIPPYICIEGGVEYYIQAVDSLGNPPGHFGSEDKPYRVSFASGPRPMTNTIAFLCLIAGIIAVVTVPKYIRKSGSNS